MGIGEEAMDKRRKIKDEKEEKEDEIEEEKEEEWKRNKL